MAREVVEQSVCDFCAKTDGVETFTVTGPGKPLAVVDVCPTHAAPFLKALEVGSTRPRRTTAAVRERPATHRVVAIEDFMPKAKAARKRA